MKRNFIPGIVLWAATLFAIAPANAQTVHVVGAAASSQFLTAALGADQLAFNDITAGNTNGTCTFHWSFKNGANLLDNRAGGLINPEVGNVWIVWVANQDGGTCATSLGNTGITDIWAGESVDSTVAVRTFSAQQLAPSAGSGALLQVITPTGTGANLITPAALWADGYKDVAALPAAIASAIGTGTTTNVHVNAALTDLRPEDALYATARTNSKINKTNYDGLGYTTSNPNIGLAISTSQGTGTSAQPVNFGLAGQADPLNPSATVPNYVTIPVGAAPIVFVFNNGNAASYPVDVVSGITPGLHATGQTYPLANLFDGTTACQNTNPAFDAFSNGVPTTTNINLVLREPLASAMNVTEFTLFRTFGNLDDSQEKGVTTNPLNQACAGGGGKRERAISTSEVVTAVQGNPNTLGYIFYSFANASKLAGAEYNYLTIDGVDPLAYPLTAAPQLPVCPVAPATTCPSSNWPGGLSYPHLRDGTYKAWSFYRWVTLNDIGNETDPYGPAHLAQAAQNAVDNTIADYVPFQACPANDPTCSLPGTVPTDGLELYRSHFKRCLSYTLTKNGTGEDVTCAAGNFDTPNNGAATAANATDSGNTLGGGTEVGGDVGGFIEGPFGTTLSTTNGYVTTSGTLTAKKGYKITWVAGDQFTAGKSWEGSTITIGGVGYTVASVAVTAKDLYVVQSPGANKIAQAYSAPFAITYPAAAVPGVTGKLQ